MRCCSASAWSRASSASFARRLEPRLLVVELRTEGDDALRLVLPFAVHAVQVLLSFDEVAGAVGASDQVEHRAGVRRWYRSTALRRAAACASSSFSWVSSIEIDVR